MRVGTDSSSSVIADLHFKGLNSQFASNNGSDQSLELLLGDGIALNESLKDLSTFQVYPPTVESIGIRAIVIFDIVLLIDAPEYPNRNRHKLTGIEVLRHEDGVLRKIRIGWFTHGSI